LPYSSICQKEVKILGKGTGLKESGAVSDNRIIKPDNECTEPGEKVARTDANILSPENGTGKN
jgi:hypothetical protein